MAEHQSRSPPESTESLLKKLCFILAESKQGNIVIVISLLNFFALTVVRF